MPRGLIPSFTHRAWWWVFVLFIATPALVLALLGLQAISAREIERELDLRDQQTQLATLVDSALARALDRVAADALVAGRRIAIAMEKNAPEVWALENFLPAASTKR
jgi:hypothetical protein